MSEKKKAAFPNEYDSGMTLREYYAGLAMQGMVTSRSYKSYEDIARAAYRMADALIAELQREAGDE